MTVQAIIVDDSERILTALGLLMQSIPEVEVVATAREGYEALDKIIRLEPDLVLLDVFLPELSGFEVCREIKRSRRNTEVIMMSINSGEQLRQRCLACGAADFLPKISINRSLADTIGRLVGARPQVSPS